MVKQKKKRKVKLLDTSRKNEVIAIATKEKSEVPKDKYDTFRYLYQIQKGKDGKVTSHFTKLTTNQIRKLLGRHKGESGEKNSGQKCIQKRVYIIRYMTMNLVDTGQRNEDIQTMKHLYTINCRIICPYMS